MGSALLTPLATAVGLTSSGTAFAGDDEGCSLLTTPQITYYQVCLETSASSNDLQVGSIKSWGHVRLPLAATGSYHIELTGPSVPANENGPTSTYTALDIGLETVAGPTWNPAPKGQTTATVEAGNYSALLWLEEASGGYDNVQTACVSLQA